MNNVVGCKKTGNLIVLTSNTSWYLYNFRRNTIKALLSRGCHVLCLAPLDGFSLKLKELGAEYISIPLEGQSTNVFSELKALICIFLIIMKYRPNFVFNFTIKMNIYVGLICRVLRVSYANNVSGLGTAFLHSGLTYRVVQKLYGIANKGGYKVFFQNNEDKLFFIEKKWIMSEQAITLPGSGVDVKRFKYQKLIEGIPFTFIMIARLIADKGVREFVQAARNIKYKYPDARFILVGPSGVSNKTVIPSVEVEFWKSEGVVELVGEQADVIPWLVQSHVLVLPSYREGMPKTVLEAASIGRPSIVTNVPGCRESIIDNETGWLCEVRNVSSLTHVMESVLQLSSSKLIQMSKSARKNIEDNFNEDLVINEYLKCID